jgi:hypothetical protein
VKWTADLSKDGLSQGMYSIEVQIFGNDESGVNVRRQASTVSIEIRDRTPDAAEEIALRTAGRLFLSRQYIDGELVARNLVTRYPQSALGYAQLGDIYAAQGQGRDAFQSYTKAIQILQSQSDLELLKWQAPQHIADTISALTAKSARWR